MKLNFAVSLDKNVSKDYVRHYYFNFAFHPYNKIHFGNFKLTYAKQRNWTLGFFTILFGYTKHAIYE